jgi:hypothetical protein
MKDLEKIGLSVEELELEEGLELPERELLQITFGDFGTGAFSSGEINQEATISAEASSNFGDITDGAEPEAEEAEE